MCGICGIYNKGSTEISEDRIIKMRDIMYSRGPDDAGVYVGAHIGLGHRRLSILDITATGHQPMTNEDKTIWMVFNGEIYNFIKLRRKLETLGHVFKSRTDCEVVIHGYEEWGENVFKNLNGMFGVAIWDANKNNLILARDRVGFPGLDCMEDNEDYRFLTWEQVKEMDESGIDFGAHSVSHVNLTYEDLAKANWEIQTSKRDIENHVDKSCIAFCYPFGRSGYNPEMEALLKKEDFKFNFILGGGLSDRNTNPLLLNRITLGWKSKKEDVLWYILRS